MNPPRTYAVVVNHAQQATARRLATGLRPVVDTLLIDSGSELDDDERALFDVLLPNVFYCGLLREAVLRHDHADDLDVLLFVCSDVTVEDHPHLVRRVASAFEDPGVGVYAPALPRSGHPQMVARRAPGLREVCFVEGVCFASRLSLLRQLLPLLAPGVNTYGWGIDIQLGFLAARAGLASVVDDGVAIEHPDATGYDVDAARRLRSASIRAQPARTRWFHRLAATPIGKSRLGWSLMRMLPW